MFRREPTPRQETDRPAAPSPEQSWKPLLAARLVKNHAAEIGIQRDGLLPVKVRVDRPRWIAGPLKWIFPVKQERTVRLDALGRELWEQCDGNNRVGDLVDGLARRERLTFHEARVAVTQYVQELVKRGVLVAVMDPNREAA